LKSKLNFLRAVLSVRALSCLEITARAHDAAHEDLTPCAGSAPEPGQSAAASVAFCNRTGHDIEIEFHDNTEFISRWNQWLNIESR
jgi:hypothetical protein